VSFYFLNVNLKNILLSTAVAVLLLALVKAILINGAQTLKGCNHRITSKVIDSKEYDVHQGFGAVSLLNSLPLKGKNNFKMFVRNRKKIIQSGRDEYSFKISDKICSKNTFSVTITWMDEAGAPGCSACLVNDIDLRVRKNDNFNFFPNGLKEADHTNNVERVRVPVQNNDVLLIIVDGTNFKSEKMLYSLAATGCFY